MSEKRRLASSLRMHAYFLRLLISLCVLCVCVCTCVCFFYGDDFREAGQKHLAETRRNAGTALAHSLNDFTAQLTLTAMQTDAISGQELTSYLRGVEYSLSSVTRLCVYDPESERLIGSAGEEPFELFVHTFFPNMSAEQFTSLLRAQEPASFSEQRSGVIAFPVKTQRNIVLYILNAALLQESANALLPQPFRLLAVMDAQGNPLMVFEHLSDDAEIFSADDMWLSVCIASADKLGSAITVRMGAGSILMILLACALLIAAAVWLLYRPVKDVRALISDSQREELRELDEFAAISTAIADGERLQEEMLQEALEQRNIAVSRLYEKLLYGIRIPPEKLSALPFASASHFQVAVAPLGQVQNVNTMKTQLVDDKCLYVLELYDTAHLAFICTADDCDCVMRRVHEKLGAPLGVGRACGDLTGLHRSYIEAVSALGMGEGVTWFTEDSHHPEEDPRISALADALVTFIQSDRERAMIVVDEIFDLLDTKENSLLFRQHAYVRFVMPFFERVRKTYPDVQFSIEPITNATHWGSVSLKERFCETLTQAMDSLPARKPPEHEDMLFFVEGHLFDPYFGLGDIAQKYNITEYTASRLFKEVGGVSFKKYVTNRRIERAKYLLTSSSLKMSEIAQQCGFASASYFARIFRNAEDLSPAEYRQQTQQTKPQ